MAAGLRSHLEAGPGKGPLPKSLGLFALSSPRGCRTQGLAAHRPMAVGPQLSESTRSSRSSSAAPCHTGSTNRATTSGPPGRRGMSYWKAGVYKPNLTLLPLPSPVLEKQSRPHPHAQRGGYTHHENHKWGSRGST